MFAAVMSGGAAFCGAVSRCKCEIMGLSALYEKLTEGVLRDGLQEKFTRRNDV